MDDHRQQLALGLAQHAVRLQVLLDRRIMSVLNVRGLSRSELDVLGALAERGDEGARPRELSARLLLTTGGLSNILRRLHEDGLIERERDASDARSQIIRLTAQGQTTAHETALAATEEISRALEPVDPSALEAAAQSLHRVLVAIGEDGPVHRDRDRTA
jgi:DNA-binding MarR family transcriptional regulator